MGRCRKQSVSRWKGQFLAGGKDGLAEGGRSGISDARENELLSEIEERDGAPSARRTSNCGCGASPLRAAWALRGPLDDPCGCGDARLEVHHPAGHP